MGRTPAHRAPRPRRLTPTAAGAAAAGAVAFVVLAQTVLLPAGDSSVATAATAATPEGATDRSAGSAGSEGSEGDTEMASVRASGLAGLTGPVRMALVGDSYLNGKGAPDGKGMGDGLAKRLDAELVNFAEGGTGWADDGPEPTETSSYDEHAPAVVAADPDLVVVAGGYNDHAAINAGLETYDEVAVNARRLLADLADADVRTVVFGPFWVNGDPPDSLLQLRDVLRREADRAEVAWVDPIAEGWIDGDRRDMTGNAARFIRVDRIHPTGSGHRYFAKRMAASIRALG
ncbi:SGNH/GDSL hydrolase family protein [Nocardioidaceae bacterium]|nr:SGNH/GDSL hydrolase family protein [Nocardioidaceae bacterium]